MKKLLPVSAAALALFGAAPAALATTQIGEHLSFSGFGTVGAVRTNSDEGTFGRDRQIGGADRKASLEVDSNLGLQLMATATPWLSATVQVLAAKQDGPHINAKPEWAYFTLKPIEGLTLRGGRMATPVFLISDSRNVGYANNWIRAPNEVYALNGFRTFDGLDAIYRQSLGPVAVSVGGMVGKSQWHSGEMSFAANKLKGLNLQLENDWGSMHASQMSTDVKLWWLPKPDTYKFTDFGVTFDRNYVVLQAELVRRQTELMPVEMNARGWYLMGGYRFGKMLPYAILSSTRNETPEGPWHAAGDQKTTAVGLRWDAFRAASIKVQVDRIDTRGTNGISFTTPLVQPPSPQAPPIALPITRPVIAGSVALDFTF